MKCEHCNNDLNISKSKMRSDTGSEDVYCDQTFVCTNRICTVFCGNDLNNPKIIAKTVAVKVTERKK